MILYIFVYFRPFRPSPPLCATPEQPIVLVTQPRRIAAMTVAERIARPGGGQV